MDKVEAINIAKRYIDNVSKKYQIESVFLFGSYAKGNFHLDSDIDLAIIINEAGDIIDTQIDLMSLRTDDDLMIEPHPFFKTDFQESNPVVAEIIKNGIEILNHAA
jgi:uncharacterized protein